ncbi:hypothetical protein AWZ03_012665 [Drosophila navojoa]|uniref:U2A'/phosphoprotein 32 family A C-terminal domain-containing protein n=2 Tax=Drosophila navojoa TaxID=7232 RepID=A0A484AW74_DRONA|nr:leucine-rich melanocyte differentiation-associated protein isoform X1 [Drosophila navojoa]TDG40907.1 hypothetical protein AWZ03_012665 [Drosophila navojoa]
MSETSTSGRSHSEDLSSNNCRLQEILKTCANIQSLESLSPCAQLVNDVNDSYDTAENMVTPDPYSFNGFISNSTCGSEDGFTDIVLEEDNRVSLAYENLCTIPRRLADKFAAHIKFLDLSYNNFRNLKFLMFFEELHTLILDRNSNLDVNTFPYMLNLKILWINNCDICNLTDWIHRIERHCPALEQLSCMGNPGIQTAFKNQGPGSPTTYAREYILQVLPNLKFVDGISRHSFSSRDRKAELDKRYLTAAIEPSSSCVFMKGQGHEESTSASEKPKSTSPTLSFKELFRLKSTKKAKSPGGSSSN